MSNSPVSRTLNMSQIRMSNLRQRDCRLSIDMLAAPPDPNATLLDFYESLPRAGGVDEMVEAANCIVHSALAEKDVLWMIDADLIESGLSPLVIKLITRGLVKSVAMTSSAAVRDFELASHGRTCEAVGPGLKDGMLGMCRDTGENINSIINDGVRRGFSLGECLSRGLRDRAPSYVSHSILAACAHYDIPVTIHLSMGADGFQFHPLADATLIGKGGLKDVQILSNRLENLNEGGVIVSAHSNPVLHESFLRAYAIARNLGRVIELFALIRFDDTGRPAPELYGLNASYKISGPMEFMLPLFGGMLLSLVE